MRNILVAYDADNGNTPEDLGGLLLFMSPQEVVQVCIAGTYMAHKRIADSVQSIHRKWKGFARIHARICPMEDQAADNVLVECATRVAAFVALTGSLTEPLEIFLLSGDKELQRRMKDIAPTVVIECASHAHQPAKAQKPAQPSCAGHGFISTDTATAAAITVSDLQGGLLAFLRLLEGAREPVNHSILSSFLLQAFLPGVKKTPQRKMQRKQIMSALISLGILVPRGANHWRVDKVSLLKKLEERREVDQPAQIV